MSLRPLLAVAALLVAGSAAAQSATVAVQAGADATTPDAVSERHCLRHTGTHVRRRPAPAVTGDTPRAAARRDCAPAFGRAYTREDIERTGRVDIGDALRTLDPSIR